MPWEDRKTRFVGGGTVTLADGREVPVVAALVLKVDPDMVPGFTYDRHTSWAGSIHTDTDDDLRDAAPGRLTLPDGRTGTFMSTSGSPDLVGVSGLGPAPFGPVHGGETDWETPELALDDASPPAGFGPDAAQWAAAEQERAQRRGMTADELQARYRVRWIPD
ncbi:hypothetical protein ACIBG6_39325 [Streptomyces sp. NPDC050842]|uniref:hypothetical protein n=1 Tax=Streptomyces sp. NPDC050842 TaxID=3365636 RepID=UPI0037AE0589